VVGVLEIEITTAEGKMVHNFILRNRSCISKRGMALGCATPVQIDPSVTNEL